MTAPEDRHWIQEISSNAAALCRTRMSAPWGMDIATFDGVMIHYIVSGECFVRGSAIPTLKLENGDLVLVPHGLDHQILSSLDAKPESLEEFLERKSRPITDGIRSTLLCGVYLSGVKLMHPILATLPPAIHFRRSEIEKNSSLDATIHLLAAESESPGAGSETLIQHLFDSLFVFIVRAWADTVSSELPGWPAALRDLHLSRALSCIHATPGRAWTVELLAQEAGMSRAAFARHFAQNVGEAPLAYLTRWRMLLAARLILSTETSMAQISEHVGYESEFAFSRAFKRHFGIAPIGYRRTCLRDLYLTKPNQSDFKP
jgi:AraC family transcriptional activator of mtrCDE